MSNDTSDHDALVARLQDVNDDGYPYYVQSFVIAATDDHFPVSVWSWDGDNFTETTRSALAAELGEEEEYEIVVGNYYRIGEREPATGLDRWQYGGRRFGRHHFDSPAVSQSTGVPFGEESRIQPYRNEG